MRRIGIVIVFCAALPSALAAAPARVGGAFGGPPIAAARSASMPGLTLARPRTLAAGIRIVRGPRARRDRLGGGWLGDDGLDPGVAAGYADAPLASETDYAGAPPPYVIPAPSPCLPPRMITVGRGLTHPPKVRVLYGIPACAGD